MTDMPEGSPARGPCRGGWLLALLWLPCMVLAACAGGEDASGGEETAEPAGSAPATETPQPAAAPSPDVRDVEWAEALGVDLDAMERRESGLYVQVLREGSGPAAAEGDEMRLHYTVWLPDGGVLDSSLDHDPPDPLPMTVGDTRFIAGWIEGATGMREGERRRLVVPYDLAYGASGRPPRVRPYTPLVFELELVALDPAGG